MTSQVATNEIVEQSADLAHPGHTHLINEIHTAIDSKVNDVLKKLLEHQDQQSRRINELIIANDNLSKSCSEEKCRNQEQSIQIEELRGRYDDMFKAYARAKADNEQQAKQIKELLKSYGDLLKDHGTVTTKSTQQSLEIKELINRNNIMAESNAELRENINALLKVNEELRGSFLNRTQVECPLSFTTVYCQIRPP
jgi:chromosome segregation ATPase